VEKNRHLRTLHVGMARTLRGGEVQQLLLMEGLRELGHEVVHVGRAGGEVGKRSAAAGINAVSLPPAAAAFPPLGGMHLASVIRRLRPDVVHLHDPRAAAIGARAYAYAKGPAVVVSRRVDFPVRNTRNYTRGVDRVIAVSQAVADVLIRCGIASDHVSVVHSALDPSHAGGTSSKAEICRRYGWPDDAFIVGALAALAEHKGLRYLVEAAPAVLASNPKARFLIAGEGERRSELEALVAQLGLGAEVQLPGFTDRVADTVASFDACVLPSISGEGSPGAVKEALAAGVPVIGADSGGIPEVVGEVGLLVPTADSTAIARAVLDLSSDAELRSRLAAQGSQRIQTLFSPKAMVAATLDIYYDILSRDR